MKYQLYEKYKDSGIEWLGEVPRHWNVKQLRFCIKKINNGTTTLQVDYNEKTKPVSRIETISNGTIDWEKVGWIEPTPIDKKFLMKKGDILLSHINSLSLVGNCAALETQKELFHGMNLLRLQPIKSVDYKWLLYLLKSKLTRNTFEAFAKPAINQASLPTSIIKSFKISAPPDQEQTTIANFLDRETKKIDTLISKIEQAITKHREYKTALISAAVTGKIKVTQS